MVGTIIILLFLFWLLAYTPLLGLIFTNFPVPVLSFFGRTITLWDIVIFLLVIWAIGVLPSPFRQIAFVVFALWLLSTLGIFALFPGFSGILILIVILSAAFSLLGFD